MYMTKYTRDLQKLVECIKDIFGDNDLSIDTRALVLFLAGTMSNLKFNLWIDRIVQLDTLNAKYKEINGLKNVLGSLCCEYIILSIIKNLEHNLNSDELQRFIWDSPEIDFNAAIEPALTFNSLVVPPADIIQAKQIAASILIEKLKHIEIPNLSALLDTYVCCRQSLDPSTSYHALESAIKEILISSGITHSEAQDYSNKLVTYSLGDLIDTDTQDKTMLHSYKQGTVLR